VVNLRVAAFLFVALAMAAAGQEPGRDEFARAMQFIGRGEFAAAEQTLLALEKARPAEFEIRYRLGLVLLRQNKTREAVQRLEAAVQMAPSSPLAWMALAQARLKLDQRDGALQAAAHAAKLVSNEPPLLQALTMFYTEACRSGLRASAAKDAVNACGAAVERSNTAALRRALAQAHRLAKNPAQAVAEYQAAIRVAPDDQAAYLELGAMLLEHRTPQPAVAVLESAIPRFPKELEFRRLLGLAYYQTGLTDKAIDAFFSMADLDPDSEIAYASLETLLEASGARLKQIADRLETFRSRQPTNPVGHFLLAKALGIENAPVAEREALLREALKVEPAFWPAYYELGELLEAAGKPKEAAESLNKAVALNPEYAPAHYSLARVYTSLQDRTRAVEHRKKHHELLSRQKENSERARAESPTLQYRMEAPPPNRTP
jgi:tetratricopeptide (TPR) repeat protein